MWPGAGDGPSRRYVHPAAGRLHPAPVTRTRTRYRASGGLASDRDLRPAAPEPPSRARPRPLGRAAHCPGCAQVCCAPRHDAVVLMPRVRPHQDVGSPLREPIFGRLDTHVLHRVGVDLGAEISMIRSRQGTRPGPGPARAPSGRAPLHTRQTAARRPSPVPGTPSISR